MPSMKKGTFTLKIRPPNTVLQIHKQRKLCKEFTNTIALKSNDPHCNLFSLQGRKNEGWGLGPQTFWGPRLFNLREMLFLI